MLILKPSRIHIGGVGVFSSRAIKKGEDITRWFGDDWRYYKKLPKDAVAYLCYEVKGGWCGPSDFNHIAQGWYVNHSDKPNIRSTKFDRYKADRNIKKGEELTINYDHLTDATDVANFSR